MLPEELRERRGGFRNASKSKRGSGIGSIIQCQTAETRSDLCLTVVSIRSNLSRSCIAQEVKERKTRGESRVYLLCIWCGFFFHPDPPPSRYISRYVASTPIIDIPTEAINATWRKKVINCKHDRRKYRRQTLAYYPPSTLY